MFKVIAKLTIDQQAAGGKRKTPPRDLQNLRKTPPRYSESTRSTPPKDNETVSSIKKPSISSRTDISTKSTDDKTQVSNITRTIFSNTFMVFALFCYAAFGAFTFQSK